MMEMLIKLLFITIALYTEIIDLPLISIVVLNYNGKGILKNCIDSIENATYPQDKKEIIIVDNNSSDGSKDLIHKIGSSNNNIKLKLNNENLGWSGGNNEGIKLSKGEIIFIISNDVQVEENFFMEATSLYLTNRAIGIQQPLSISSKDKISIDSGANYIDRFGYWYGYIPNTDEPIPIFFAEGMAFSFKREVLLAIGPLDQNYFMMFDDLDFSWRARLFGFEVYLNPKSKIFHSRGGTVGNGIFRNKDFLHISTTRNHLATLYKNLEFTNYLLSFVVVVSVEIGKTLFLIAKGQYRVAKGILKGVFFFFLELNKYKISRKFIQNNRIVSDKMIKKSMHSFSIIFQIFQYKGWISNQRFFKKIEDMEGRIFENS